MKPAPVLLGQQQGQREGKVGKNTRTMSVPPLDGSRWYCWKLEVVVKYMRLNWEGRSTVSASMVHAARCGIQISLCRVVRFVKKECGTPGFFRSSIFDQLRGWVYDVGVVDMHCVVRESNGALSRVVCFPVVCFARTKEMLQSAKNIEKH